MCATSLGSAVLLLAFVPAVAGPGPATGDPQALELAREVDRRLGGAALRAAGALSFTFAVGSDGKEAAAFRHVWDLRTGRYAVEGPTDRGRVRVVFDLATRQGRAWLDGAPQDGDAARQSLEWGYGRVVNDTYWLLVPFKLLDPGVRLASAGERSEEGRTFDLLALSFDGVGLTPGDRYTLWIDRQTRRVDRWEMLLEGRAPPPSVATWHDWVERGGVWFSIRRVVGKRSIELRDVAVTATPPEAAFAATAGSR